jgi:hypothetical protein
VLRGTQADHVHGLYGLHQDRAADIVVSIKQHVQEQRDEYEVLQTQWPKWKETLRGSVHVSRETNKNETRPTEVPLWAWEFNTVYSGSFRYQSGDSLILEMLGLFLAGTRI